MAIKKFTVTNDGVIASASLREFRVPAIGKYHQGLQDIYSGEWFDQNKKPCPRAVTRRYKMPPSDALPSTIQLWGAIPIGEFFPLTRAWQQFWVDLIDRATEYSLSKEVVPWQQLTDKHLLYWWRYATQNSLAMTDGHAAWNDNKIVDGGFADYMIGVNLDNPKPIAKKSLDMSGNIFKEIGRTSNYIVIETINAGYIDPSDPKGKRFIPIAPPKVEDVWDKPWLIHWGVESTTNLLPDKSYTQSAFPPKPYGLPFPVLGIDGKNWIKPNRVKAVKNGDLFSPYHP
jgi:hypothetical protein